MYQLDRLYQALERADAAGDTKAARELATYIKSATEQEAPEEEFKPPVFVPPPPGKAGFSPKDTALALGQGIVGAGKSIADVFGADNAVSNYLGSISSGIGQAYTPARQAEMQERAKLQAEASKSGDIVKEINAFLGGVAEAPVQALAQGLGSIVPYVGTGVIGGIAKLGGATIRAVNTVVGAAQGAGAVKGSIYDNVKDELLRENPKMTEKEAKDKASKAQEYLGSNFLDIVGGATLGAAGARYGVENLLTPGTAAKLDSKLIPRIGKAMLAEAPLEGLQGGQEQLAINRALIDEGFKREAMEGVYGATVRDAVIGAMTAGVIGVRGPGRAPTPASTEEPPIPEAPKEITPLAPIAPTASMFDEQGNLVTSTQATPEEIAAAQAKPTATQLKEDADQQLAMANLASIEEKQKADIEALVTPKFEAFTPAAKKLLDLNSIGAKPPVELTPKEIKQIAETNGISYLKDNKIPLSYDELIGELNAKAGASNGPVDTETSGKSVEVPGERGTIPTKGSGELDGSRMADVGSDVVTTDGGEGDQQPTLVIPPAPEEAQVVEEEVSKPEPFLGINPSADRTRTEEDLYPKAIERREEQKAIAAEERAAEPTLEQQVKAKERLQKLGDLSLNYAVGDENAKRTYDKLPAEDKAQVDFFIDKLKKLKKPEVVKPRKASERPVGISYTPKEYKARIKEEKAAAKQAAKEAPVPKKLSLLEERLQQFRAIKSEGSANLEALEELRGGTTVGLMANLMHGDLRGALQEIVKDTSGQFTNLDKTVARRLLNSESLPKIQVVPQSEIGGANGRYDAATDIAYVGEDSMTSHTVLHEALHGFTLAIIKAHKDGIKFNQGVKNLENLYDHLKNNYPELEGKYGMKDLAEFVSEAMSNSEFQEILNAIPYKRGNLLINGFVDFVKSILNLLNISPTDNFTALAYAMVSTESILTEGRRLEETNPPPATAALAPSDVTGLKQPIKLPKAPNLEGAIEARKSLIKDIEKKVKEPTIQQIQKNLTSKDDVTSTWQKFVKNVANRREVLGRIYNSLERQNELITIGPNKNNTASEFLTAVGKAEMFDRTQNKDLRDEVYQVVGKYASEAKINPTQAMANLHLWLEVLHEPERRFVKYMLDVPLKLEATLKVGDKMVSPADLRKQILKELNTYQEPNEDKRHAVVKALRERLENIVKNKNNLDGSKGISLDINSQEYNVIANRSPDAIAKIKSELEALPDVAPYLKTTFKKIEDLVEKINISNIELNKIGNFWTPPVDNWKTFYDYKHYIPFKGKPDTEMEDTKLDPHKKILVGLQEGVDAFSGRESESDNILEQVMIDSILAARRAGFKDVTLSIKNSVKQKVNGVQIFSGKLSTIKFDENRSANIKKERGQNKIFHYEPNGDITVIELLNTEQREAIRNTYKKENPFINILNSMTSGMGQMHTRYNPSFAPINFTGDILTNSFTMGVDFGPKATAELISEVSSIVAGQGGFRKGLKVASLYRQGKLKELKKYTDPKSPEYDSFYADLVDYLNRGGKISYMEGFATDSATEKTIKIIKHGGKQTTKETVDNVLDMWTDMFEFASRAAAYRVSKGYYLEQNRAKNMNEADALEDAKNRATYYAKNLANFEQVGEYGKVLGALYMFARPAATGAVRAIEALTPMLRKYIGREKFDTSTAEGKALEEQARNGRIMIFALLGIGAAAYTMSYMMSDDDEEGRNRTATDDMDRWQKYMRFHIPKELVFGRDDIIFQMRWGYGLGAFASAGAQVASLLAGNSSFKQAGVNVVQAGLDSFMPLPISRINIIDNPAAWFLDSALPSTFRPFLEYTMNLDGLGREIYTSNQKSRVADAYTGSRSVPEMYISAARTWLDVTGFDISPSTLYFFANNGIDGLARIGSDTYNLGLVATGLKQFNPKTDTIAFDSFFGAKSNYDSRKFTEVEKQVKELQQKLKTYENDPERYMRYIDKNPMAPAAVEFYEQATNQDLRDLRTEQNRIQRSNEYTPKERKEMLDNLTQMSNMIKRNMLMNFETLGYTP